MGLILMYAGQTGPRVKLADCLREIHAASKESRKKQIEKRKENGIPLDDSVKWPEVCEVQKALTEAIASDDSVRVNKNAAKLVEMTSGGLSEIGDLVLPDGAEEIEVVFRVLADSRRRELAANDSEAWARVRDARASGNDREMLEAVSSVVKCRTEYVKDAVASIFGIEGQEQPTDELCDALSRAGLLSLIHDAASYFQDLPAKKALRFGAREGSIYRHSTATAAQSTDGSNLVAMAARENQTGAARFFTDQNGKPIRVQDATY